MLTDAPSIQNPAQQGRRGGPILNRGVDPLVSRDQKCDSARRALNRLQNGLDFWVAFWLLLRRIFVEKAGKTLINFLLTVSSDF